MITEIEVAKKLTQIKDINSEENIVNSGRIQGINIYRENINILIAKKNDENSEDISIVEKTIKESLSDFKNVSIDIKEGELKKSEITHLLNMSKVDKEEKVDKD